VLLTGVDFNSDLKVRLESRRGDGQGIPGRGQTGKAENTPFISFRNLDNGAAEARKRDFQTGENNCPRILDSARDRTLNTSGLSSQRQDEKHKYPPSCHTT
jgi:hypothetical protein